MPQFTGINGELRRHSVRQSIKQEPSQQSLEELPQAAPSPPQTRVARRPIPQVPCHRCINTLRYERYIGTKIQCVYVTRAITRCTRCVDQRRPCTGPVAPEAREDAVRLMAMNESLRKREPGAPSVEDILDLAKTLNDRLGRVPGYNEYPRESQETRAVSSEKSTIPQVTTDLVATTRRNPRPLNRSGHNDDADVTFSSLIPSPDGASFHHELSDQSPVDAIAAFLNARPIHNNASTHRDSDAGGGEPESNNSQTFLLAMILDALRQGVEIYARVNGQDPPVWPDMMGSPNVDHADMSG